MYGNCIQNEPQNHAAHHVINHHQFGTMQNFIVNGNFTMRSDLCKGINANESITIHLYHIPSQLYTCITYGIHSSGKRRIVHTALHMSHTIQYHTIQYNTTQHINK